MKENTPVVSNVIFSIVSVCTGIFILLAALIKLIVNQRKSLRAPGMGYGWLSQIGSWRGALLFMLDPRGTIKRGYDLYKGIDFKVSKHTSELTRTADEKRIVEYLAAREEVLSFGQDVHEFLQQSGHWATSVAHRKYYILLIMTKFTKTTASSMPVYSV